MIVTCPACGAQMDFAVLLAHEDSRQALAQLAQLSLPFASLTVRYLALFKPATRQMSHARFVALVAELLPDMQRQALLRNGREWSVPPELWKLALERMLELRDAAKLTLPLKSHGYLYEIVAGLADKHEAQQERAREDERRSRGKPNTAPQARPIADVLPPAQPGTPSAEVRAWLAGKVGKPRELGDDHGSA